MLYSFYVCFRFHFIWGLSLCHCLALRKTYLKTLVNVGVFRSLILLFFFLFGFRWNQQSLWLTKVLWMLQWNWNTFNQQNFLNLITIVKPEKLPWLKDLETAGLFPVRRIFHPLESLKKTLYTYLTIVSSHFLKLFKGFIKMILSHCLSILYVCIN